MSLFLKDYDWCRIIVSVMWCTRETQPIKSQNLTSGSRNHKPQVYGKLSLNPKKGITCGNIENLGQEAMENNKLYVPQHICKRMKERKIFPYLTEIIFSPASLSSQVTRKCRARYKMSTILSFSCPPQGLLLSRVSFSSTTQLVPKILIKKKNCPKKQGKKSKAWMRK